MANRTSCVRAILCVGNGLPIIATLMRRYATTNHMEPRNLGFLPWRNFCTAPENQRNLVL
jgi:hypothetical protein